MNNEFWMRDEKRKKKKKTKKEAKRRENYYLAGRFLQRRRFHRLFHSEQAFHFSQREFVLSVQYSNCCEDEVPSEKQEKKKKETFSNKLVRLFSGTVEKVNGDCV